MIGIGPGTRVMVATRPVDFRKGPDALSDEATEFQIKDRLSFQRFLGVGWKAPCRMPPRSGCSANGL